jgi:hypothetical protein
MNEPMHSVREVLSVYLRSMELLSDAFADCPIHRVVSVVPAWRQG